MSPVVFSRGEVSRAGVWLMPLESSPYTLPKIASLLLPIAPRRLALVRSEVEFQVCIPGLSPRGKTSSMSQVSGLFLRPEAELAGTRSQRLLRPRL